MSQFFKVYKEAIPDGEDDEDNVKYYVNLLMSSADAMRNYGDPDTVCKIDLLTRMLSSKIDPQVSGVLHVLLKVLKENDPYC